MGTMMQLAGLYVRLSREDEEKDVVSQSIRNQQDFLLDYCSRHGILVIDIYCDDGFSGTNFNRPGFLRMIQDIEDKKINLVLTKDLSRLGRDYILTGHYLERYFPEHQVRFIAINDHIDTGADPDGNDMAPFRAVFNDLYAKDISKKVRTALNTKRKMGKFIGTYPPYGYQKDAKDKNHLIIEEEQAENVRMIYQYFRSGDTILQIARRLTEQQIPTPSEAKHFKTHKSSSWNYAMIRRILTLPTYCGNLASHMTQKISYKVDKIIKLPQEEWYITEGTHEPIISKEEFEEVQRLLTIRSYLPAASQPVQNPFTGMLFCADCGSPMILWSNGKCRYFVCSAWKKAPSKHFCTAHYIREDVFSKTIRTELEKQLEGFYDYSQLLQWGLSERKLILQLIDRIEAASNHSIKLYFRFCKQK